MISSKRIETIELQDLIGAWEFFERHSGIAEDNIDPKYADAVFEGKKMIDDSCRVKMVFGRVGIESRDSDSVTLSTDQVLSGKMAAKVLENSDELYAYVIALDGFSNFSSDDIMVEYFGDTWGTAYVEYAQALLANSISEELNAEGLKRTHLWSPGQTQFGIENQRALFSLLNPEDIDCTLTSRLMMNPVKSASGIMGVIDSSVEEMLKPCDYCTFKKSCPASKRGCAAL